MHVNELFCLNLNFLSYELGLLGHANKKCSLSLTELSSFCRFVHKAITEGQSTFSPLKSAGVIFVAYQIINFWCHDVAQKYPEFFSFVL